jgi:cell division protein FtsL
MINEKTRVKLDIFIVILMIVVCFEIWDEISNSEEEVTNLSMYIEAQEKFIKCMDKKIDDVSKGNPLKEFCQKESMIVDETFDKVYKEIDISELSVK